MNKILILANNDVGLYKFRKELIVELLRDNQIFIALPDGEYIKDLIDLGCKYINLSLDRRGVNPYTDFKLIFKYHRIIKNVKPNLIMSYTIKPNIYGGIISRLKNIEYASNITGLGSIFQKENLLKRIIIFLYKVSLRKAKVVFFENNEDKNSFISRKLITEEKAVKLNGSGVNLNEYPLTDYPSKNKKIRFLFIGRIMKEKGIEEYLEAAQIIRKNTQEIQFDVIGPLEEDYEVKLNKLVNLGIINYHGFQKDIKPFIKQSHCLVLPSYHEGMANTLLESGAMGRPLIASNIPGCKEAIIDGETGYLVNKYDLDDLIKKLNNFIILPHDQKKQMGFKSRLHIEKNFDKKDVVKKTIQHLR